MARPERLGHGIPESPYAESCVPPRQTGEAMAVRSTTAAHVAPGVWVVACVGLQGKRR
jgi:hypothetical protein